jgi:hypothetical protein
MVTIRLKVPVFSLFSEPYVQAKDMIGQDLRRMEFERADGTWAAAPGLDVRA